MPPSQGTEIALRRADIFPNPKNGSDLLPVVYGKHIDAFHRVPTVEIEVNEAFLISDDSIQAVSAVFNSDGNEVDTGEYTVFTDGQFKGEPRLLPTAFRKFGGASGFAFVLFSDPVFAEENSPFSVNCIGKRTSDGETEDTTPLTVANSQRTIENSIEILVDFLFTKGGFSIDDFDFTTINESIAKLDTLNHQIRWVFDSDATVGQWIIDLAFQFFGNSFVTNERKLAIVAPSLVDHMSEQFVVAHIHAKRDCVGGDDGPSYSVDEANIITRILINYDYDWENNEFRKFEEVINRRQEEILGQQFEREIEVKGVLTRSAAVFLGELILDKFPEERGVFTIPIRNMKAFGVQFGELLGFTWYWGPGGRDWVNRIVKVLDVQEGLNDSVQSVVAEETGLAVIDNFNADGSRLADGSSHAFPGPSRVIRQ